MTFGPNGGFLTRPKTVEQAYDALRFHCERLEELLEANSQGLNDKALKRSDKAVTVMKVGFKILKKALGKQPAAFVSVMGQRSHKATAKPQEKPDAP